MVDRQRVALFAETLVEYVEADAEEEGSRKDIRVVSVGDTQIAHEGEGTEAADAVVVMNRHFDLAHWDQQNHLVLHYSPHVGLEREGDQSLEAVRDKMRDNNPRVAAERDLEGEGQEKVYH